MDYPELDAPATPASDAYHSGNDRWPDGFMPGSALTKTTSDPAPSPAGAEQ